MRKSLIAAAMLGLGAGGAMAQSSVTIYGKVDVGGVLESGVAGGGRRVAVTSGVSGGSRLGFKGTEDLGDGLKAGFQLETGFCADSNAGTGATAVVSGAAPASPGKPVTVSRPDFCSGGNNFMGRQAHVDLSGGFGSVALGRQYTPAFIVLATADPFGTGLAGAITNVADPAGASGSRANNAAIYSTPTWGGFQFSAMGAAGETTGNWKAGRAIGGSGTYASGPLWVGLGYNKVNTATGASGKKNWIVGATYDFGAAKAHAMFQTVKDGTTNATQSWKDASEYMLGVSAVFGQSTVLASVVGHNDKTGTNLDARQVGLGYYYALSRRTSLYAAAAHITNKNGAFHTVGNGTETGTGNQALNLGVVHNF